MKGRFQLRKEKADARQALVDNDCACSSCPHDVPPCCTWEVCVWPSEAADIIDGYPGVIREVREKLLDALKNDISWRGAAGRCPLQDAKTGLCRVYNDAPWTCVLFGLEKGTTENVDGACGEQCMPSSVYRIDDAFLQYKHYQRATDYKDGTVQGEEARSKNMPGVENDGARVDYLPEALVAELIRRGDTEMKKAREGMIRRARKRVVQAKQERKRMHSEIKDANGNTYEIDTAEPGDLTVYATTPDGDLLDMNKDGEPCKDLDALESLIWDLYEHPRYDLLTRDALLEQVQGMRT